jgi:hypothetical protein
MAAMATVRTRYGKAPFSFYFTSFVPFLSHLLSLTRLERSSVGKGVEEKQGVTECARWKYVEEH